MTDITRTPLGRIAIEPDALVGLVRAAAEEVDGARVVRPGRTLRISLEEDGAATVAITLSAPRRVVLPELGALVQQRIAEALETVLTAPSVRVDVTFEAIHAESDG